VIEKFNGNIWWIPDRKRIVLTLPKDKNYYGFKAILVVGSKTVYINGYKKYITVPPIIKNGKTYIPSDLLKLIGFEVKWYSNLRAILIAR
jgi:hypothetical protein